MARFVSLDLSVARSNEPIGGSFGQVSVLTVDDVATIRAGSITADPIPALEGLEICACRGEQIGDLFITNDALAGSLELILV